MRDKGAGSIIQRKDGIWQASLQVDKRRVAAYGKTKTEARAKLAELKKEATIHNRLPSQHTLYELLDAWLKTVETTLKPHTIADYQRVAGNIKESLGDMPLSKLTPSRIQSLYQEFKGTPRKALYIHQVLHRALRLAELWGWVNASAANRVIRPSYRKKEKTIWTVEQCKHFVENGKESTYYPLFLVGLYSGLRIGELLGLRWDDIDWQRNTIKVERSLEFVNKKWVEGTPKTSAGKRTVHIDDLAMEVLKEQKKKQIKVRFSVGEEYQNEEGRVFTTMDGRPILDTTAVHSLARLCKQLDLPVITMHTLRHLHASLTLQAGAPIALVSRQLGHANVSITTAIYSHAISDGKVVAEALKKALEG